MTTTAATTVSWFLVLAISVGPGLAVYHMLSMKTYKVPGLNDDALFGFSVSSMAKGSKSKLIVGAPQEDNIGGVFTCDPTTQVCSSVGKAIKRFIEDDRYNNQSYWYGATVAGTDDFFVACAPRFIAKSKIFGGTPALVGIFGLCYSYEDSNANPILLSSIPRNMQESEKKFEDTVDTLGWTLNIDSDDSIYIGGPGMTSGRLIKIRSQKSNQLDGYAYGEKSPPFNAAYNFGYSVTTGMFSLSKFNRKQVAAGSTYGVDGRGKVIFWPSADISRKSAQELVGPFVGSMFGAALCTATFSDDRKRGALLVGAPTFADRDGYNTGAVYVYTTAVKKGLLPTSIKMIAGEASNSFFGSAILNVGDLNGDKKDEIAIAAPYYGNTGCVYLYSGADLATAGRTPPVPLQKINPSTPTRTFGYSLGLLKDYDENGCDELVIGAPQSNKVVVLRCIAVITVTLKTFPNTIKKSKGDETKLLPVCLDVQFPDLPRKVNAEIKVEITIQHNGASLQAPADGQVIFKINEKKTPFCEDIKLFLNETGKYNQEISYNMKATQLPPKDIDFKPENVRLSVKSKLSVSGLIRAQECGDEKCKPILAMTATYFEKSPYVIGSTPSIDASISVMNTGDVAYDACLHIDVSGAEITRLPNNCHALESAILECTPNKPVYNGKNWDQIISVDTTALTNENQMISVTVSLYNECGNISTAIYKDEKKFQLKADADYIQVQGRTDEGVDSLVNLTRVDIAAQKQFQHVYTISNSGPTNWVNVPINLTVQKLDIVTTAVYLGTEQCKLNAPSSSSIVTDEDNYFCKAESISKDTGIQVNVIYTVVTDTLNAKIGKENVTVYSKIQVKLNGILQSADVTSELRLIEGVIPIWVIIAASILAFIILVIIFFILREFGCLKRKNKEELKRVRMSVRRQTMMRKSMMARPPSADQEALVKEAEASHESDKKKKDRRVIINDL